MKTKIISIFICMLMCVTVFSVTGIENVDVNEKVPSFHKTYETTKAPWDLLFDIDVGNTGRAGVEFDGTYFYTCLWSGTAIDKFDINGNYIETFSIPGVSGLRDLCYDGEYMYGGAAGGTIWQMDFDTETLIGQIDGGFECRAIAYNKYLDVFYCSNWNDPVDVVDRTGAVIDAIFVGVDSTYGLAFDEYSDGGPYLWVFDQGAGSDTPQYIHQWDLAAGVMTGFTYDVSMDLGSGGGIAGGLFVTLDYDSDYIVIGGVYQDSEFGDTDIIFGYELDDAPENPIDSNLYCSGNLFFTEVEPGSTVTGTITIENVGDIDSLLDWELESNPDWGDWTFDPESGIDLLAGDTVEIEVEVVAPDEENMNFTGEIVFVNSEMSMDTCTIDVTLATPVSQSLVLQFLDMIAQRFPILGRIFAALF